MGSSFPPRLLRLGQAPDYVGMDRNRFNSEVRPYMTEIPIGIQGIAIDRIELDAWVDDYKQRNGRPGLRIIGDQLWDEKERPASFKEMGSGTSTKRSTEGEFEKAVKQIRSRKQKPT